jgi:arylsulfatase A-like enzyme
MTDDQRDSEDGYAVMPNTMRIFRQGGREYSNAISTTPLCCPARASLYSGQFAHNHGVTQLTDAHDLDMSHTLQFQLKRAGYLTAHVGKFLNNFRGRPPHFDFRGGRSGYYLSRPNGTTYGTTVNKQASIGFLKSFEQQDSKPWLMFTHIFAPHVPFVPENKYATAPVPAWTENPATSETDLSDKPPHVQSWPKTKAGVKGDRVKMLRTLKSADDLVGAVFAHLERLGEAQNTLAVFASDHGFMWYENTLDKKRQPYDRSVEIPLFLRWPGHIAPGSESASIATNVDIAATIYDATRISPSYVVDGKSLIAGALDRRYMLIEFWSSQGVPGWKGLWSPSDSYVEWATGFKEFYGADDPWQLTNVFEDGVNGNEPDQAALASRLSAMSTCAGSPWP